MIEIELNGDTRQVPKGSTLNDLVTKLGLTGKRIAVEYNLEILPKSEHADTLLQVSDRVEIVHAIGGG
jgi:sulfur carrier protein